MSISIKKETSDKIHKYCSRGEKHDNFVNRLIDICERDKEDINISNETLNRLFIFTGCNDPDEALVILIDKYKNIRRG